MGKHFHKEQIFSDHPCNQNLFGQSRLNEESGGMEAPTVNVCGNCSPPGLSCRSKQSWALKQGAEIPPAVHAAVVLDVPFNCFLCPINIILSLSSLSFSQLILSYVPVSADSRWIIPLHGQFGKDISLGLSIIQSLEVLQSTASSLTAHALKAEVRGWNPRQAVRRKLMGKWCELSTHE